MPRVYPPKRTMISVRLSPSAIAGIDKLAADAQLTRSTMVRILLAEAIASKGWKPASKCPEVAQTLTVD